MTIQGKKIEVLDHGYVKLIGSMGDDEEVIEAARMSTGRGFVSWLAYDRCKTCEKPWARNVHGHYVMLDEDSKANPCCGEDGPSEVVPFPRGDEGTLEFLYSNKHMTPFEMGELCVEVQAPIFVFREWHRHRTQSYNEFSARYAQMPDLHYVPELERIQKQSKSNKQGSGDAISAENAQGFVGYLKAQQAEIYSLYESMLEHDVAKEVARINTPVSRYSKMRAKTDVRNWLSFLMLRMDNGAQWEIRQYANAVAEIVQELWPRTFELFLEHDFLSVRFSRTEMRVLQELWSHPKPKLAGLLSQFVSEVAGNMGMSEKQAAALNKKLIHSREDDYKHLAPLVRRK